MNSKIYLMMLFPAMLYTADNTQNSEQKLKSFFLKVTKQSCRSQDRDAIAANSDYAQVVAAWSMSRTHKWLISSPLLTEAWYEEQDKKEKEKEQELYARKQAISAPGN